jgi:amidase
MLFTTRAIHTGNTSGSIDGTRPRWLVRSAAALIAVTAIIVTPTRAAGTFDLSTASIADINAAFDAGALTSERLTSLYLARIAAYDKAGPRLNSVLHLNPKAIDDARLLDAERRATGRRTPLHGVPVLLKANIEVAGWPATAGFYALRDSLAAADAEQAARLRRAGCVLLGLTNMSEFASGPAISTLGGQIRNPYALDRSPAGSSGGSGAAVAAGFAAFALGTDTGGSIRGPASANGIAGLRPTFGLTGRGGIIPLALSLDTVGPMAAHVADLAIVLNVMVGSDSRDPAVVTRPRVDYTATLDRPALRGVRLGLARDFMGADKAWDAVIESAVARLRTQGAEVVDVAFPRYVHALISGVYPTIRDTEFRYQIEEYLASLPRVGLPRTHAEIVRLSEAITAPTREGWVPNPARLEAYRREAAMGTLQDQPYRSAVVEGRKIVRDLLDWTLTQQRLDALIGPTIRPARFISEEATPESRGWRDLASLAGWPDLVVPAGYTGEPMLPVGISFLGPAFSEARLLALGHAFERADPTRRPPPATPALRGERFEY